MASDIEDVSSKLLGSQHRLRVAAAVAAVPDEDEVLSSRLKATLVEHGVDGPTISYELARFVSAGLLVKLAPRDRYRRVPSVYWHLCAKLLEELTAQRPTALRPVSDAS